MVSEEVVEYNLGYDEQQDRLKYKIYATTFLGYGANKIFDNYIERIITLALK